MTDQDRGGRRYEANREETNADAATDPRDGGCPECGRPTHAVPLTDFGLERGQLCSRHGIVAVDDVAQVATDGGADVDADADDADDDADACDCDALNSVDAGDELECWHCFRTGGDGR